MGMHTLHLSISSGIMSNKDPQTEMSPLESPFIVITLASAMIPCSKYDTLYLSNVVTTGSASAGYACYCRYVTAGVRVGELVGVHNLDGPSIPGGGGAPSVDSRHQITNVRILAALGGFPVTTTIQVSSWIPRD